MPKLYRILVSVILFSVFFSGCNIKEGDEGLNITAVVLTGDILNLFQDLTPITPNAFGERKPIGNPAANVFTVAGGKVGKAFGALRHGAFDTMRDLLRSEACVCCE